MRRVALVLAAVGLGLLVDPTGAGAATLERQGWWSRLSPGGLPVGVPAGPAAADGQLVVEGAPEGPLAIAAVRFRLDAGESNPVLTLREVSQVGADATTVVLACLADVTWQPAEGGSWDSRPIPDCTTSAQGAPADDGTWSFPLTTLTEDTVVDVVLVPGQLPSGPDPVKGSVFRLVLADPALQTSPDGSGLASPTPPPPPSSGGGSGGATPTFGGVPAAGGGGGGFTPVPTTVPGGATTPTTVAASTPTTAETASGSLPSAPVSSSPSERARWLGFVILALAAAIAVGSDRLPALRGVAAGDVTVGGLGRFARERTGPPPKLL